jgi:hypothetical protein
MMHIKLTKIKENPDGKYSASVAIGKEMIGDFVGEPVVGKSFVIPGVVKTSPILEVLDNNTFKTYNSVYRYEFL